MYDAYICVPQTLTLMLVCMMHISMILDSCMYEARMVHASTYDAIFFGNEHTFNGRSSSSSRSEQGYYGVGMIHACMMHVSILIHMTTMHICMMHLSMILNPDTCTHDA